MTRSLCARAAACLLLLVLGTVPAGAQSAAAPPSAAGAPAWLQLAQGKNAFAESDNGRALQLFRASIAAGGDSPEAEMWIGRVFEVEGETQLAIDQYNRALAMKRQFLIPDDAIAVQYSLANLYMNTGQYGQYEVALRAIVAQDSYFSDPSRASMRDAMMRILRDGGLDRLLTLYRFRDERPVRAHSDLGVFAYRTGRYQDAELNLTFAVITMLTTAIDALERADPDFQYGGTAEVIRRGEAVPRIASYFSQLELFRDLYYLAAALYADGQNARARSIWQITSELGGDANPWRQRAALQLRKPFIEPILDLDR